MTGLVCENCATPLPGGSNYCNECGTSVPGQDAGLGQAYGAPADLRQALLVATSGEYEIHHELGRGGMGSVFLAREIGLDRLVAIKVLPPSLMFDEGLVVRFAREARMVAKLHHPNIIPVYRVHHSHNLAFYTMHFVSGRSLGEIMGSSRALTMQEVEKVVMEAAAGLGYAHKRGVIHRDVKPANVLLDAEGQVHLTDFGIAKALVGNTQLTETGAVIGTPQYMAPEQCDGRAVDGRADQYSLAVLAYQLVAGHPPFEADSMKELIYHHLFTPPKPLGEIRSDTPISLRDAIHKALSKDPADRFNSMEDLQMAIEGKGPPIFVKWIDETGDGRKRKRKRGRRATDLPTTQRIPEMVWVSNAGQASSGPRLSSYQRAVAALAVAAISISAVGVLALSSGAGLAGSLRQNESDEPPLVLGTLAVEPSADLGDGDIGSPAREAGPVETEPGGEEGTNGTNGTNGHNRDNGRQPEVNLAQAPAGVPDGKPLQPRDTRLAVPAVLLRDLQRRLEQGRELYNVGLYMDAGDTFKELQRRAAAAKLEYRDGGELAGIVDEALKELGRARTECKTLKQDPCP